MNEIFADKFSEITVTGPLVRIDLASLSAIEKEADGTPKAEFRQRVILPVESFLQAYSMMGQVVQQLEKHGMVTRAEPAPAQGASAPAKPKSPNFG
jgi:hypothetical protein